MKLRYIIAAIILSPVFIQGLCNKEEVSQGCSEMITWVGSGIDGFYQSHQHDSHFREIYYAVSNTPEDICIDVEIKATFRINSVSGIQIPNVNLIEGRVFWGDQEKTVELPFSDSQHAYVGIIEHIDIKPYFDEHPTPDGSGIIDAEFVWHNLSVGSEETDLQYVTDKVSVMDVQVEYIKK